MENSLPKGGQYERDFVLWADGQAALLRAGRVQHLDLPALAEEIEALAARERSSVKSQVGRVYVHLLEFAIQPEEATWHWKDSITNAVDELSDPFDISRSLEGTLQECRPNQYLRARRTAQNETRLPLKVFPLTAPQDIERRFDLAVRGQDTGVDDIVEAALSRRSGV